MELIKCVVVGDGAVGKTCMLMAYTTNTFPKEYVPTVFENYEATVQVDGLPTSLSLFDTAGQEAYDRMRPLSYDLTNVFLVCFAVNSQISFNNVENKWIPELKHHAPGVPFLIIGTKSDMRNEPKEKEAASSEDLATAVSTERKPEPAGMVSVSSAKEMEKKLNAAGYLECSAMEQESLQKVFNEAIRLARNAKKRKSSKIKCRFL